MSYLSAKKIYPGNFTEALNGWYKNVDTTDSGSNDKSVGGPTSVLAVPGYRYFQQRGYAQITGKVGAKVSSADVIVASFACLEAQISSAFCQFIGRFTTK